MKPTTIRLVLALVAHFDWTLRQLNITNAFPAWHLQEEVHTTQPPRFEDPNHPT